MYSTIILRINSGLFVRTHNTLSRSDIVALLDHTVCGPKESKGYLNQLILILGIKLGMRPTEMHEPTLDQFNYNRSGLEKTLCFQEKIYPDVVDQKPNKAR